MDSATSTVHRAGSKPPSISGNPDNDPGKTPTDSIGSDSKGPAPDWHILDVETTIQELATDPVQGLNQQNAQQRLEQYGRNELIDRGSVSPWKIIWEQITGIMVLVLIVAGIISAFLGDLEDTVVIFALVFINAAIGFYQEFNAEKAMAALKKMAVPVVRARRDGRVCEIPAPELVAGDIVLLEAGSRVPADGRLLVSAGLQIQEAALTGESVPVTKQSNTLASADIALGDRRNMAYMGTDVTRGRGEFAVTATGMRTELGKIADLIQDVQSEQTPLQRRLDELGKLLAALAVAIVAIVFVLGWLRNEDLEVLLLTAISLAVAAVPEGLPATVTIALSLGAQRMLRRHALIRKLPAVETLGSVTYICSDKTGTLTENRMTVTVLDVAGNRRLLKGEEAKPLADLREHPSIAFLLAGASLCNDAKPQIDGATDGDKIMGDPTEVALIIAGNRQGLDKQIMDRVLPRVAEQPFDSDRKRMTTVHRRPSAAPNSENQNNYTDAASNEHIVAFLDDLAVVGDSPFVIFTKGAVDSLLDVCSHAWNGETAVPLDREVRQRIRNTDASLAEEGLRVLGVGFRLVDQVPLDDQAEVTDDLEQDLILVGMMGMIDPARPEVRDAVQMCKDAGILVRMVTGDHPATAAAIARELGIEHQNDAITGQELHKLSDEELRHALHETSVYARVAPEHKLRIVRVLQMDGAVVAMTGDGVNDAPALKQAEIGVAMGITGTDVTKEAADMVLQDDNFATIVAAVREGRVVYANIRKFIRYLLTGNVGEIFVMLAAPFLGMPLPLLPLQILWINLLTDGLPALALGVEKAESDIMRQPPRSPTESILGMGMGWRIIWSGIFLGLLSLAVGYSQWYIGNPNWQTMVFTTLTFGQMAAVLTLRSESEPFLQFGIVRNPALIGAVILTVLLQLAVTYVPFLQQLFETHTLSMPELFTCIGVGILMLIGVEIEQALTRHARANA